MGIKYKVYAHSNLYHLFLVCVAMMPFVSLFWQSNFFFIKLNWILYPLLLIGVWLAIITRLKAPSSFVVLVLLTLFYFGLAYLNEGENEAIVRFVISLVPFTFFVSLGSIEQGSAKFFWWLYAASFCLPVYYAYLQYIGQMPFYSFDDINNEVIGRISGGYNKPMNFIAFLLPIYLAGFYLWKVKDRNIVGLSLIGGVLVLVYVIGHRTSLFAFCLILLSSFFMTYTTKWITFYYQYFFNFFVGIGSFLVFRLLLFHYGIIDLIRGRVPIWQAHSEQFFSSGIKIFFGDQKVMLGQSYQYSGIALFDEVHSNSYRTILLFGIVGFFLYCIFMRSIVMRISHLGYSTKMKFIVFSGFTYFIIYTITNEPLYYGSVLWPIMIWIFLAQSTMLSEQ